MFTLSHHEVPRSPWPLGLGLVFAAFLAVQMHMVRLATRGFEGPDEVQYYKLGIEYDRELQRQVSQRKLGWRLAPLPSPLPADFQVEIRDAAGRPVPGELSVSLGRPATRSQDQEARVEGRQVHWAPAPGPWRLTFNLKQGPKSWRHHQRVTLP